MLNYLKEHSNIKYRDFIAKLVPNISKEEILGVKMDVLRKYIKTLSDSDKLLILNNKYYYQEENLIKALIINDLKNINIFINYLKDFRYEITNWAVNDVIVAKQFKNNDILYRFIYELMIDKYEYSKRLGIYLTMKCFINYRDLDNLLEYILKYLSSDYYVEMALAWLFQELYVKNKMIFTKYYNNLNERVKKYTKRKILDSKIVSAIDKEYIRRI